MVKSHVLCEPGFHCGSCTCELGTKEMLAPGTRALPGTTGGVTLARIGGNGTVLPSVPIRIAVSGAVPLFPLQGLVGSGLLSMGEKGARHRRLCPKPTAWRVSMAVCTPFKRSEKCQYP